MKKEPIFKLQHPAEDKAVECRLANYIPGKILTFKEMKSTEHTEKEYEEDFIKMCLSVEVNKRLFDAVELVFLKIRDTGGFLDIVKIEADSVGLSVEQFRKKAQVAFDLFGWGTGQEELHKRCDNLN